MPSINLDLDYFSHPKVVRLKGVLGVDGGVYPLRLWTYAAKYHCEDGCLTGYTVEELESVMGWTGETGKCVAAMEHVRFLHKCEGGYELHEWKQHAAHLVVFKKRAKTAAKKRWGRYASSIARKKTSIAQKDSSNALTFHNKAFHSITEHSNKSTETAPAVPVSKGKTSFPEGWKPELAEMEQWRQLGIDSPSVEFATFRDHALTNDRRCKDWPAAWRNWCRKSLRIKEERANGVYKLRG